MTTITIALAYLVISVVVAVYITFPDRLVESREEWLIDVLIMIIAWPLYLASYIIEFLFKKR